MENYLVFCAHADDEVLGVGGTIAKYAEQGKNIITVVFSYGEASPPWLTREQAIKLRVNESKEAGKILGTKHVLFLGISEGNFLKECNDKKTYELIMKIIKKFEPKAIFTHSNDDANIDHREVNRSIMNVAEEMNYKGDIYSFEIKLPIILSPNFPFLHFELPIRFKNRYLPRLYVDITHTFQKKMNALSCFGSQKIPIMQLIPIIYARAIFSGWKIKRRYAEKFYKIN